MATADHRLMTEGTGVRIAEALEGMYGAPRGFVNYMKDCGMISSLPVTLNDSSITSDMVVLESTLGTPSAMTGDWTITTSDGSVTIAGSISGSTTLTLYFGVGVTTSPTVLTNLASDQPANLLSANPRPGVTGTLDIPHGGTGAVTAPNARTNLDVYSKGQVDAAIQQATAVEEVTIDGESTVTAYKMGRLVQLALTGKSVTAASAGWVDVFTIPHNIRPVEANLYFCAVDNSASTYAASPAINMRIGRSSLKVQAYAYADKLTFQPRFLVTYFTP